MRKIFFVIIGFALLPYLVNSCSSMAKGKPRMTASEMWSVLYDKSQVKNYALSDTDLEYIMAIEDSLLHNIRTNKSVLSLQRNRCGGLMLLDLLTGDKSWLKKDSANKYLTDFINKNLELQFKFDVQENDSLVQFNLLDCFLPKNHKIPENSYGDYFDFYVYVDKVTKKCTRISCILPEVFDGKEKPGFFAFVIKNNNPKDPIPIGSPKLEYNSENQVWTAIFDPPVLQDLFSSQSLYFMVGNSKEEMETSCINLTWFKKQYKQIIEGRM